MTKALEPTSSNRALYHTEWVYQMNRRCFKFDKALWQKPQCNIRFIGASLSEPHTSQNGLSMYLDRLTVNMQFSF